MAARCETTAKHNGILNVPKYLLYYKCVVAELEPQLQSFCRKTWNGRDYFREVHIKRQRMREMIDRDRKKERVRKMERESEKDGERE